MRATGKGSGEGRARRAARRAPALEIEDGRFCMPSSRHVIGVPSLGPLAARRDAKGCRDLHS